jgi:hypothetical protein
MSDLGDMIEQTVIGAMVTVMAVSGVIAVGVWELAKYLIRHLVIHVGWRQP